MPGPTIELRGPAAEAAGGRSALYQTLARCFRPVSPSFHQALMAGRIAEDLRRALATVPYKVATDGEPGRGLALSYEELESTYMALFEVGGEHGGPCFLYEGEYGGGRMKVLEEVLRFYDYFGLRLAEEKRERPDHLATELEFMHALSFKEAEARALGREVPPLLQAQRDFLRFHVEGLVTAVAAKIGGSGMPFYPDLARLATTFCQREIPYLEERI